MKRLFDVVSSIYGLVVLSPILLITALLIKMESPGPAIFKQKRPTINNKQFSFGVQNDKMYFKMDYFFHFNLHTKLHTK